MDALKALFSDFDFAAFIPNLDTVLGWIQLICRLCVMAGPLLLLGFGLVYLLCPPKEANHRAGYRFWWSMASLDAWQFTHRLVGMIWSGLGLLLTIIMALICNGWNKLAPMDMVWSAVTCLLWELGLTGAACLGVNITVMVIFDKDGFRRKENKQ
jgi:uncharacterized membrane protein